MQSQNEAFGAAAREVSVKAPQRLSRVSLGLVLGVALLTSGCAVLVNDQGQSGVMRSWDVVLGMDGKSANRVLDATQGVPIAGKVARNILGGRGMAVDAYGRTVLDVPPQETATIFCGFNKTDCPQPLPAQPIYTRQSPDSVNAVCAPNTTPTILDPPDSSQSSLLICRQGTGPQAHYVAPALIVNGAQYSPDCGSNGALVGALRVDALRSNNFVNAATCLRR